MPAVTTLPPRVRRALAARGLPVLRAVRLPGHGHAATFTLDLVDGRRLKARRYRSAADAARVERCIGTPGAHSLPRPVARIGRWLAVEFVEGTTLDRHLRDAPREARLRFVRAAGRMLARLHAVPSPAMPVTPRSRYPRVITLVVRRLARQGRLPARAGEALRTLSCPTAPQVGLTHGDACPENLVRTPSGRLRAIDEERVAVRPVAYDIARAICRWPLDAGEERAWLSGYAAGGGDTGEFLRHRAFWIAAALATSAAYRMRYRPGALGPIVKSLKSLATAIAFTATKVTKDDTKFAKR